VLPEDMAGSIISESEEMIKLLTSIVKTCQRKEIIKNSKLKTKNYNVASDTGK